MRLKLRRIFRRYLGAVKNRSILASDSTRMFVYPGSPPLSDPADAFWIWTETACFSVGAGPDGSPPARPPGGHRRSSPAHAPGYTDRNSWYEMGRTGSSSPLLRAPKRICYNQNIFAESSPFLTNGYCFVNIICLLSVAR